jgi:hypothetical protein
MKKINKLKSARSRKCIALQCCYSYSEKKKPQRGVDEHLKIKRILRNQGEEFWIIRNV